MATQTRRAEPRADIGEVNPTLVIQTAFLGDVVLTIPLLTALAAQHGPVDVLVTPNAAPLVETHPAVRTVISYDKERTERGLRPFLRLVGRVRGLGYRRAYLPHQSWRSGILALLAGIPTRIGFGDAPARWTYTARVARAQGQHETKRLLGLSGSALAPTEAALGLTADDRAVAAEWLRSEGISGGFIALAPGSVWGTKRWPYYADLAEQLPDPIVVVGGHDVVGVADEIVQRAPGRAATAAGLLSLRQSAALLEYATVLVTNDSAPLHIASMLGIPMVAIFGPTVPAFGFGPLGSADVIVEHTSLPCRPCSRHGPSVCPLGHHRCMTELGVETVADAVARVLDAVGGSGAIHRRD